MTEQLPVGRHYRNGVIHPVYNLPPEEIEMDAPSPDDFSQILPDERDPGIYLGTGHGKPFKKTVFQEETAGGQKLKITKSRQSQVAILLSPQNQIKTKRYSADQFPPLTDAGTFPNQNYSCDEFADIGEEASTVASKITRTKRNTRTRRGNYWVNGKIIANGADPDFRGHRPNVRKMELAKGGDPDFNWRKNILDKGGILYRRQRK